MNAKRNGFALALAGAIGTPYLFSSSGLTGRSPSMSGVATHSPSDESANVPGSLVPSAGAAGGSSADHTPIVAMQQAFRLDVTTAWVLGRWPRVSAGLGEFEVQGYRVPLVTGTQPDDVAGSLTYYFDRSQRVDRITFQGSTGDARRLVALLATQFGFVRRLTDDASLFLYEVKDHGKPISELRIKPSRIVRADSPHTRFELSLVLKRTEGK